MSSSIWQFFYSSTYVKNNIIRVYSLILPIYKKDIYLLLDTCS